MNKLPSKASKLIRLAVADADTLRSKGIKLNMDSWASHKSGGAYKKVKDVCTVCLAGAAMVGSLKVGLIDLVSDTNVNKMQALNFLRIGNISMFLRILECPEWLVHDFPWPKSPLTNLPRKFRGVADTHKKDGFRWSALKKALLTAAEYLEQHGN